MDDYYTTTNKYMKTKGQLEEAVSQTIIEFERSTFGKGPDRVKTVLTDTFLAVYVQFARLPWEDILLQKEAGHDELRSLKRKVVDVTLEQLQNGIQKQLQTNIECGFHDICMIRKERMYIFRLQTKPAFLE